MSLVEFFFNSDYRESLQYNCKNSVKKIEEKIETEKQIIKKQQKFFRDYHLKQMQDRVNLLNDEIIYNFISIKNINIDNFTKFLQNHNAKNWVIPVLWNKFKLKHNI